MRDKLKDKEYFANYIDSRTTSIERQKNKLILDQVPDDRISIVENSIANSYYSKLIAKYSIGEDIINLKEDLLNNIDLMNKSWINNTGKVNIKGNQYLDQYYVSTHQHMLQSLSLAYLLDVPNQYFQILIDIIDRDNISDSLYEFIIKARFPDRYQKQPEKYDLEQSVILKVYDKLRKATELMDIKKASKLTQQFLEKDWYQQLLKYDCISDAQKSKANTYYGYWSFEAAAVVKIMGLDDSSFIDNQYYPKDLVHQDTEPPKKKGFLGKFGF